MELVAEDTVPAVTWSRPPARARWGSGDRHLDALARRVRRRLLNMRCFLCRLGRVDVRVRIFCSVGTANIFKVGVAQAIAIVMWWYLFIADQINRRLVAAHGKKA